MKTCNTCGETKALEVFRAGNKCKECAREYAAAHYQANKELYKQRSAAWDRVNRERKNENARRWAQENPDKVQAAWRRKQAKPEHKARRREYERGWRARNPDKVRLKAFQSNVRRRGGYIFKHAEIREWAAVLYADPCAYCGGLGGEIDHIDPVVGEGTSDPENLTAACRSCNAQKYNKPLLQFLLDK